MDNNLIISVLIISISGIGLILGVISIIIACLALSKAIGIEKSTHTVQMMPIDPEIDKENKKFMEEWATKDEVLKEQSKLYREDLEEKMPEFIDEEQEIISW